MSSASLKQKAFLLKLMPTFDPSALERLSAEAASKLIDERLGKKKPAKKRSKGKQGFSNAPYRIPPRSIASQPAEKSLCSVCGGCFIPGHKPVIHNGSKAHMGCITVRPTTSTRGPEAVLLTRSQPDGVS